MTSTPLSDERLRWIEFEAGASNSIILPDMEARIARQLLSDAEHDLNILDIQIAELCSQREQNAARLERLRVAVAPHKRLPAEVLSYIFGISSGQHALEIPPPDPQHSHPRWTLRHVCSAWRHIVLSDRRLWNWISMNFEIGTTLSESDQLRKIRRSKRVLPMILPKSGTISMSFRITGSRKRIQKAIQTFIQPYSGRIAELSIGLPSNEFLTFLWMFPDQVDALAALELEFIESFPVAAYPIRDLPPSLRKLVVKGDERAFSSLRSRYINWENIVDLDLFNVIGLTFAEIFSVLKHCKRLEECSISHWNENSNPPSEHAVLPHLHYLKVLALVSSIFDGFTLPSLRWLVVKHKDRFPAAEISSMIRRSGCNLTTLHQLDIGRGQSECDLDSLVALLGASPSLETMFVPHMVVHQTMLEQIGQGSLLPNLKIILCRLDSETLKFASSYFRGGNTPDARLSFHLGQHREGDGSRRGAKTILVHICHASIADDHMLRPITV